MTANRKTALLAAAVAGAAVVGALVLAAFAPPAHAAGRVEVRYVEPERFSDIGRSTFDRDRTLAALSAQFDRLGARLPDGQTLRIEVLDVDLAGEQSPLAWHDTRVMRGGADAPRATLRWTLLDGAATLRGGEDRLVDLGYLFAPPRTGARASELPYESRMLERWFDERVAAGVAKAAAAIPAPDAAGQPAPARP